MKTLSWFVGLFLLLSGCKREEPQPGPTEINMTVVDEDRMPVANMEVFISGRQGDYFGGIWRDTTFASPYYTDVNGLMTCKFLVETKWRLYVRPSYYPAYNDIRFEGSPDGKIEIGRVNKFIAVVLKR